MIPNTTIDPIYRELNLDPEAVVILEKYNLAFENTLSGPAFLSIYDGAELNGYVVRVGVNTSHELVSYLYDPDTEAWSGATTIASGPGIELVSCIEYEVATVPQVAVFWYDNNGTDYTDSEVYCRYTLDGSTWQTPVTPTANPLSGVDLVSIAACHLNELHYIERKHWHEDDGTLRASPIQWFKAIEWTGSAWVIKDGEPRPLILALEEDITIDVEEIIIDDEATRVGVCYIGRDYDRPGVYAFREIRGRWSELTPVDFVDAEYEEGYLVGNCDQYPADHGGPLHADYGDAMRFTFRTNPRLTKIDSDIGALLICVYWLSEGNKITNTWRTLAHSLSIDGRWWTRYAGSGIDSSGSGKIVQPHDEQTFLITGSALYAAITPGYLRIANDAARENITSRTLKWDYRHQGLRTAATGSILLPDHDEEINTWIANQKLSNDELLQAYIFCGYGANSLLPNETNHVLRTVADVDVNKYTRRLPSKHLGLVWRDYIGRLKSTCADHTFEVENHLLCYDDYHGENKDEGEQDYGMRFTAPISGQWEVPGGQNYIEDVSDSDQEHTDMAESLAEGRRWDYPGVKGHKFGYAYSTLGTPENGFVQQKFVITEVKGQNTFVGIICRGDAFRSDMYGLFYVADEPGHPKYRDWAHDRIWFGRFHLRTGYERFADKIGNNRAWWREELWMDSKVGLGWFTGTEFWLRMEFRYCSIYCYYSEDGIDWTPVPFTHWFINDWGGFFTSATDPDGNSYPGFATEVVYDGTMVRREIDNGYPGFGKAHRWVEDGRKSTGFSTRGERTPTPEGEELEGSMAVLKFKDAPKFRGYVGIIGRNAGIAHRLDDSASLPTDEDADEAGTPTCSISASVSLRNTTYGAPYYIVHVQASFENVVSAVITYPSGSTYNGVGGSYEDYDEHAHATDNSPWTYTIECQTQSGSISDRVTVSP